MSKGNKITKNLNVAEGSNRSAGRKYGLSWSTYQATGGYHGAQNHSHREMSDKALENSYVRKVGQWGVSVKVPAGAKVDVCEGSYNRGHVHAKK